MGLKTSCALYYLVSKLIFGQKNVVRKIWCTKILGPKKLGPKIFCVPKNFGSKNILVKKYFGQQIFWSKNILGPKKIWGSKNFWVQKKFETKN